MAIDLTVGENQTYILDDPPADEIAEAFQQLSITSLPDLVEVGVVDSEDELRTLLTAARTATDSALRGIGRREPQSGGLARPDLGRFSEFLLNAPEVPPTRAKAVWQVIRDADPSWLRNLSDEA